MESARQRWGPHATLVGVGIDKAPLSVRNPQFILPLTSTCSFLLKNAHPRTFFFACSGGPDRGPSAHPLPLPDVRPPPSAPAGRGPACPQALQTALVLMGLARNATAQAQGLVAALAVPRDG